jgi:hypothetical protein
MTRLGKLEPSKQETDLTVKTHQSRDYEYGTAVVVPGASRRTEPKGLTPLNFKVSEKFHREFKAYAARHGVTMLELLQQGFRLVKEHRGE